MSSSRPDSIMLRWAPADVETWLLGNRYGYVVTRYTILRDGFLTEDRAQTVLGVFLPRPLTEWELYADDRYVSIAAECIFARDSMPVGANPHLIVRRYREEQNRFSFALFAADRSVMAAKLSGLYMADRSAQKNEKYLYSVHIPVPASDTISFPVDSAFVFTGISEYQPLPPPFDLQARWYDRKVELSWDILYLSHIYNSYTVEKSVDGVHFYSLSENAIVQLADEDVTPQRGHKTDTLENNSTVFYYRIRGMNAFGETGPASDVVSGNGKFQLVNAPIITGNEVINNERVHLQWTFPEEMNEYIAGFRIYRSAAPESAKSILHQTDNPAARDFIDERPELTNYYVISAFDTDGFEALSTVFTYAELIDSIPPSPPIGLTGMIDTTGRVIVNWRRNIEADLDGYRVYRANRPEFEFALLHSAVIKDTAFIDFVNLATLETKAYYKVIAVDLRQNHSAFSALLELEKPDVIPPPSPMLREVEARGATLAITWVNNFGANTVRYHIFRRTVTDETGEDDFIPLAVVEHNNDNVLSTYVDDAVHSGTIYRYHILAENRSGLLSEPSIPVQARSASIEENIILRALRTSGGVALTWSITSNKPVMRVLLYRKIGDEPLRLLTNVVGDSYTDEGLHPETTYTYSIRAVYSDETLSSLSNSVIVR